MGRQSATSRRSQDRFARSEQFELFTRPQRSLPARMLGLTIRMRAELTAAVVLVVLWVWLSDHLPLWGAAVVMAIPAAAVAAWSPSRRYVWHRCYSVMTRHRLRAAFVECRVMNFSGNVPLILWSRPSPVGDRVWVLLRAGIGASDIERKLSHVGSTCWGFDARLDVNRKVSALVVVNVIRRDPLAGPAVASPHGFELAEARRFQLVGDDRSA